MKPMFERELRNACPSSEAEEEGLSDEAGLAKRDERRKVELNGYLIRSDKRIVDVKIVDLTYDGCGIRTLVPLTPGERLKLTVLGRGAVSAVVRWYRSRKAGLLFLSSRGARPHWPRKAERIAVRAEVMVRRAGRVGFRVRAFDITRFGCKCEFVDRPNVYERVYAKFDGLESMEAVVCWVEESSLGLMFKNAMHPAVLDMLLMRFPPAGEGEAIPSGDD